MHIAINFIDIAMVHPYNVCGCTKSVLRSGFVHDASLSAGFLPLPQSKGVRRI